MTLESKWLEKELTLHPPLGTGVNCDRKVFKN